MILKPGSTHLKSVLRIFLTSKGTVDLEHVSLFPVDTWKGHENGLRKDLAQAFGGYSSRSLPLSRWLHRRRYRLGNSLRLEKNQLAR